MSREKEILGQLERILASREFHSSQRLTRLLRYLVEQSLSDPTQSISEYQLGFEVFERSTDFDPQVDSVVRVQTTRLRQKLAQYYAEEGRADPVFIEVPRGRYAISVSFREISQPAPTPNPAPGERRPLLFRFGWLAGILVLLALSVFAVFRRPVVQEAKSSQPTVVPFTSRPGLQDDASFSPDGTSVAFSASTEHGREIFIKQIQSGQVRQFTHDNSMDINPAWSPDGSAIAYYRLKQDGGEFIILPLEGGMARVAGRSGIGIAGAITISSSMPDAGPAWTKDGSHLVIGDKNGSGGAECLFVLNVQDGSRRLLTSPPMTAIGDGSPAVSPDGKTVAFVRRATSYGLGDLFLVPLEGGQPRRMTSDNADMNGAAWTTDGREIIFSSNRGGSHRLWQVDVATAHITPFAASGLNSLRPATDPTGNRLIYTEWTTNTNIWRVDLSGPPSRRKGLPWIASTLHQDSPQYSPDGRHVAFISDRSGFWELWMADSDGENMRQLTHFGGPQAGSPQWSPDSQEIAFDLRGDGVSKIFLVDISTDTIRQITHDRSDTMVPKWASDGRSLYVASRRTGQLQIWEISLDGSRWTQLTRNGGMDGLEVPGTNELLYTLPEGPGFWLLNLRTGQESVIPALANIRTYRYWALSRDGVYYVSGSKMHSSVNFYDFATHRITPVTEIEGPLYSGTPSLTVSPDGHFLAYAQVDSFHAGLVLAENW
jgi:Tol biopolymer transport system component